MVKPNIYEHLVRDYDGSFFRSIDDDVQYVRKGFDKSLNVFLDLWNNSIDINNGIYYKGTRLFFTFKDKKWYVSWTFYDKNLISLGVLYLICIGANDIVLNYGELD